MKKFTNALVVVLTASALLFTACSKKPNRSAEVAPQTGGPTGVNPDTVAVPAADVAPNTGLEQRTQLPPGAFVDGLVTRGLLDPVLFEFDRSAVDPKQKSKIDAALKYLKDNPQKRMLLEGHCDWRGTAEYNLGLGDRRANAVKKYLENLGIDPKRLEILSKGSTDAKHDGTAADWAKDRRVDFAVFNN